MSLLFFLWSLFHVHNPPIVRQHVVIQTPPSTSTENLFPIVEQIPLLQQPYRKMICFSNDAMASTIKTEDMTIVPMLRVFRSRQQQFSPNHYYPRSNYLLFSNSMYASVMGYADFCCMQDKVAEIVLPYLEDEKNSWMVWMDDPLLMGTVRAYGKKQVVVDRTTWITMQKEYFSDHILIGDVSKTFQ